MAGQKLPSDVMGVKLSCPNYSKCPLCFGCRNSDTSKRECEICFADKKTNICKIEVHKAELLSKFIGKTKLKIEEDITF